MARLAGEKDGLDSYRLIAGESDGLPGITIDRFGNFLVLQLLSAGAEYQRAALISALQTQYPECAIYDRSDVAVRKKEGMELTQGPVTGELPPALLPIEEHGMKLLVDIQGVIRQAITSISVTAAWRRVAMWKTSAC